MKYSRVKKFKEYRDSFIKTDAQNIDGAEDIISGLSRSGDVTNTTNTLPFNDVMHEVENVEEEERLVKKAKQKQILIIVIISTVALILISAAIVFGIMAFGGK